MKKASDSEVSSLEIVIKWLTLKNGKTEHLFLLTLKHLKETKGKSIYDPLSQ